MEVPEGCTDQQYLALMDEHIPRLFDAQKPDLVFYQAGVDVSAWDRLGKLKLTRPGISVRNRRVYELVRVRGVPLVVTMGGGYPKDLDPQSRAFRDVIGAHFDVYRDCIEYFASKRKRD